MFADPYGSGYVATSEQIELTYYIFRLGNVCFLTSEGNSVF